MNKNIKNESEENAPIVTLYRSLETDINDDSIINNDYNYSEVNICDSNSSGINNVNIEHSKDVVIGNVTQFHGPVTIIQNNKNHTENENIIIEQETINENIAKPVTSETKKPTNEALSTLQKKSFVILKIILILIFLCISIILGFFLYDKLTPIFKRTSSNTIGQHKIITRSEWGGRNPIYTRKLHQPTLYVIVSHTVTEQCKTIETCSNIVHNIQNDHIAQYQSPDIGYNFLIGGDENVYEGRGWDAENFHMPNSIGLCFIGNYIYDRLTIGMIEVTQLLINEGLKQGKLDKNYKLIAHNQTYNTLSPGTNVYDSIRFWPHYSPEIVEINH